ncbi:ribonuclease PH [Thermoplasma volcanium GSS1]|uniref:Exosome complex component Rrp41 n=1 Tax=Thermoplasma volcanium (strain ATCC 51530 / DSM 4299 / JCM 9571 / NBRC 15438 / GSS1) TaxID=273116 RepID=RRP41_THEVO|nr:exosome complex exonuclease Rrp41 [Thermoplasma volcanium]Q97BZ5.1 RecName: Full=Exosome complex component Rrp41 [Thermoplasma volcanium GSS1]BAB59452.1 ribonuclease PH [Thermoplasma volcanium GSS1]
MIKTETSKIKLINEDNLRLDGRSFNELRPIKIEAGVLNRADGSAYIEWGGNKIIVGVYGPKEAYPKHSQDIDHAVVKARYNMAAFSVDERKRPGPDRRTMEISKVISEALSSSIMIEQFPRAEIDVYIEVLQADAGTRIAGLTAATVALADAGIPMRDMVVGCTAGKVDGHIVLDLSKEEDNFGEADIPMAIMPKTGEIVLLQMDGDVTEDEFYEATSMIIEATKKISQIQRNALLNKYKIEGIEGGE